MNIDTIGRESRRRRFGILHGGMLAILGLDLREEANPNICFATSAMGTRTEEDEEEDAAPPGKEPDGKCKGCGMQNEADAKFCDQCGKTMAAKPMEDEAPPSSKEAPSSKEPSSSKPGAKAQPPGPERMHAPAKMSATASLALILGAEVDSPLGLKTAAIQMRQERDWMLSTLAGLTGQGDVRGAIGAALNIPRKLAAGKKLAQELATLRATADDKERWELAHRLNATGTVNRSKVLADVVDEAGNRKLDAQGKPLVRIRSRYATMDLAVFRGLVTDLEGDAPRKPRNPFEPDQAAAERAAADARRNGGKSVSVRVEAMKTSPVALRMFRDPSNARPIEEIAAALVRNEDVMNGVDGGAA